jgi:hypothetical protein
MNANRILYQFEREVIKQTYLIYLTVHVYGDPNTLCSQEELSNESTCGPNNASRQLQSSLTVVASLS